MKPIAEFCDLDAGFWAYVKLISQELGYSKRVPKGQPKRLRRYSTDEVEECLDEAGLCVDDLGNVVDGAESPLGVMLLDYLNGRAEALEEAQTDLMDRDEAAHEFGILKKQLKPKCHLPMNLQKGKKKHENYLTRIIHQYSGNECFRGIFPVS